MKSARHTGGDRTATRFSGQAFTLVEVMIAFAIFAMLVAAVYSTWTLLLRSKQVGNEVAARIQRQRIAMRTLEDSLTCVQSYQASPQYYSFVVLNGEQPLLSFVARLPAGFPRDARFGDFYLRRLTFTLEPGQDGEKDLVLRQNPILMDMDSDEKAFPLVLARNVQGFIVECWDTNQLDWVDEWTDTNSIPPLLRVTLVPGGTGGFNDQSSGLGITRLITPPAMMLPGILQGAKGGPLGPGGVQLIPGGPGGPGGQPGGPPGGPPGGGSPPNQPDRSHRGGTRR